METPVITSFGPPTEIVMSEGRSVAPTDFEVGFVERENSARWTM